MKETLPHWACPVVFQQLKEAGNYENDLSLLWSWESSLESILFVSMDSNRPDLDVILSSMEHIGLSFKYMDDYIDSYHAWHNDTLVIDRSFKPHGYRSICNSGSIELEVNDYGDGARFRFDGREVTDWYEIVYRTREDSNEAQPCVAMENGNTEWLNDFMSL